MFQIYVLCWCKSNPNITYGLQKTKGILLLQCFVFMKFKGVEFQKCEDGILYA